MTEGVGYCMGELYLLCSWRCTMASTSAMLSILFDPRLLLFDKLLVQSRLSAEPAEYPKEFRFIESSQPLDLFCKFLFFSSDRLNVAVFVFENVVFKSTFSSKESELNVFEPFSLLPFL